MHAVARGVAAVCIFVLASVVGVNAQSTELSRSPAPTMKPCAKTMAAAVAGEFAPLVFAPHVIATTARFGIAFGPNPNPKPDFPVTVYFRRSGDQWCLLGYGGDLIDVTVAEPLGIPHADAVKLMDAFEAADAKANKQ